MTNEELLAKIKAEIERRITDNTFGAKLELIDILAWLDTLESEKPMNPDEDLNEEIKKFIDEYGYERGADKLLIAIVARHFAEWQKEQMLKEAVCYIAQPDITATGNIVIPFIRIGYTALSRYGIKVGDKVRIIIVKED